MKKKFLFCAVAASLVAPLFLHATDGHQLIGIGSVQKSTAGAGVARGSDATWVLLNPAAIHGQSKRVDVSLEVFAPRVR